MIRINLAPPEGVRLAGGGRKFSLPTLPDFNLGMLFGVVYVVTALAMGGWWYSVSAQEASLTAKVQTTKAELEVLKQRVGQAGKIKEQVAELKKRVDAINQLTKNQQRPVVLFDALADVVPRDLWINSLEERGTTLKITGTSYSTTAVADFMANLRSSGRFKDVDIVQSRQDITKTPRMVTFEVTCRFES
ncbi:MAG: PilN domain-containing protein [Candidatus Rokubacteria bacterium]|nr:PilN domain-containing protein [Candidatus Rokubacteria bacterium]